MALRNGTVRNGFDVSMQIDRSGHWIALERSEDKSCHGRELLVGQLLSVFESSHEWSMLVLHQQRLSGYFSAGWRWRRMGFPSWDEEAQRSFKTTQCVASSYAQVAQVVKCLPADKQKLRERKKNTFIFTRQRSLNSKSYLLRICTRFGGFQIKSKQTCTSLFWHC